MNITDTTELSFGQRLKLTRETARYSRKALGELTGIPLKSIEKFEYETMSPSVKRLEILADALEVTTQYLLAGDLDDEAVDDPIELPQEHDNSEISNVLALLHELDKYRQEGFKKYWRSTPRAFASLEEALAVLSLEELLDLAEKRNLYPVSETAQGLKGNELVEETETLTSFLKECILDTAYFGIDLCGLRLRDLTTVALSTERSLIKRSRVRKLKGHDALVPLLREKYRGLALKGKAPAFDSPDEFQDREDA
jgi:transcriptional regulator with XRE-family HTH domain